MICEETGAIYMTFGSKVNTFSGVPVVNVAMAGDGSCFSALTVGFFAGFLMKCKRGGSTQEKSAEPAELLPPESVAMYEKGEPSEREAHVELALPCRGEAEAGFSCMAKTESQCQMGAAESGKIGSRLRVSRRSTTTPRHARFASFFAAARRASRASADKSEPTLQGRFSCGAGEKHGDRAP
jgi:hypothetical protein